MRLVFIDNRAYVKDDRAHAYNGKGEYNFDGYFVLNDILKGSAAEGIKTDSSTIYSEFKLIHEIVTSADLEAFTPVHINADAKFDPVSATPRQIIAVGINYRDHAEEMNMQVTDTPVIFTKFQSCIAGANSTINLPNDTVDYENELTVVIGQHCSKVSEHESLDYVAGITVGEDLSERTLQFAAGSHFSLGKSYPNFGPIGPELVTLDEVGSLDNLEIKTWLNGDLVQDSSTDQMVFKVGYLISYLSEVIDLCPGDIIYTGSPAGVGFSKEPPVYLKSGDVLVSEIANITRQTLYFK